MKRLCLIVFFAATTALAGTIDKTNQSRLTEVQIFYDRVRTSENFRALLAPYVSADDYAFLETHASPNAMPELKVVGDHLQIRTKSGEQFARISFGKPGDRTIVVNGYPVQLSWPLQVKKDIESISAILNKPRRAWMRFALPEAKAAGPVAPLAPFIYVAGVAVTTTTCLSTYDTLPCGSVMARVASCPLEALAWNHFLNSSASADIHDNVYPKSIECKNNVPVKVQFVDLNGQVIRIDHTSESEYRFSYFSLTESKWQKGATVTVDLNNQTQCMKDVTGKTDAYPTADFNKKSRALIEWAIASCRDPAAQEEFRQEVKRASARLKDEIRNRGKDPLGDSGVFGGAMP